MKQYDAGPGEWSDREWKSPDKKQKPHAQRRRVALPPWALLAILVGIVILLCAGLVLIVRAIRGEGGREISTPVATTATDVPVANTQVPITPTLAITPTETVVLPIEGTQMPPALIEIAPGATVVVQGTLGAGLNLRAEPTTRARRVTNVRDGTTLLVLEGPQQADGYAWWKLRTSDGKEGWGAAKWLMLKTEQ